MYVDSSRNAYMPFVSDAILVTCHGHLDIKNTEHNVETVF